MKFLALLLAAAALLAFGCIAAPYEPPQGCTEEAKLCPDGSTVTRNSSLNCEFNPCPDGNMPPQGCTKEAKTCPDGSTVTRNSSLNCEFNPCPGGGNPPIVGNDSDEFGCKASAGYSWCAEKEKCIRPWEEICNETGRKAKAREICGNLSYWRVSIKAGVIMAWFDNARADFHFDNSTSIYCAFPPPSGQDARCQEINSLRAPEESICVKGAN